MLLRFPLERTKSPSSSAASLMREARSRDTGLTGVALLPLEFSQGLIEWSEVQPLDERADLARLVPGGGELRLYTGVDLPQQLHGPVERPHQLLVGHVAQSVGEPLELADLLFEIRRLSTILHRVRTIHHSGCGDRLRPSPRRRRAPRRAGARPRTAAGPRRRGRTRLARAGKRRRLRPPRRPGRSRATRTTWFWRARDPRSLTSSPGLLPS